MDTSLNNLCLWETVCVCMCAHTHVSDGDIFTGKWRKHFRMMLFPCSGWDLAITNSSWEKGVLAFHCFPSGSNWGKKNKIKNTICALLRLHLILFGEEMNGIDTFPASIECVLLLLSSMWSFPSPQTWHYANCKPTSDNRKYRFSSLFFLNDYR